MIVVRHDTALQFTGDSPYGPILDSAMAQGRHASVLDAALAQIGWIAAADSDAPELDKALMAGSAAGRALAESGALDPAQLRVAICLAIVARDRSAMATLARVPLTRVCGPAPEEAVSLFLAALQAILRDETEAAALIEPARAAARPEWLVGLDPLLARAELIPDLDVLAAILRGDARAANRAMTRALDEHRRLRGGDKHRDDPRYLIALGPLAWAALAHDRGMRIETASDYLPLRLMLGDVGPQRGLETTSDAPVAFLRCAICGGSAASRARACGHCGTSFAVAPARRLSTADLEIAHPCVRCGEQVLSFASVCPSCRGLQAVGGEIPSQADALGLPFPPELQAYAIARPHAPSELAVVLDIQPPSADEVARRLRLLPAEVAPASSRRAPWAAWELAVRLRGSLLHVWPAPLERLPGFDRGPFGSGTAPTAAIVISCRLRAGLLPDFHVQLQVAFAAAPEAIGTLDLATVRVRPIAWLRDCALSPALPDPAELVAVEFARSDDQQRAWLHTRGMLRCGSFELEALDVPTSVLVGATRVVTASARRFIEDGPAPPREEAPVRLGPGLAVSWSPSDHARREAGVDAFGALEEHRTDVSLPRGTLAIVDDRGRRSWAALQDPTIDVPSRLDIERERSVARATLGRFRALRLARDGDAAWSFMLHMVASDEAAGEATPWCRLDRVVGEDLEVSVIGGASLRIRADQVADWEIEHSGGRITPSDALGEILAARRAEHLRATAERHRTPILAPTRDPSSVTMEPPPPKPVRRPPTPLWWHIAISIPLPGLGHYLLGDADLARFYGTIGAVTLGGCGIPGAFAALDLWRRTG